MTTLNITNIPAPRVAFLDERTGLISREWYMFFLNLFNLTGAGGSEMTLQDLAVSPEPVAMAAYDNAINGAYMQPVAVTGVTNEILLGMQAQLASMSAEIQTLKNQIDTASTEPRQFVGTLGIQNADNVKISSNLYLGNMGTEAGGIDVNGTTYAASLKISDIGSGDLAQTIHHRHSTTLEPVILGARSNSDTESHTDVTAGQKLFTITGAGYCGTSYKAFGAISVCADSSGTLSNTSAPGKWIFSVTPDTTVTPAAWLTVTNDKKATFAGGIDSTGKITTASTITTLGGATFHTTSSALTDGAGVAGGTLLTAPAAGNPTKWIGINDNGTTRYIPAW